MSTCSHNDLLRDYAFDEIPAAERPAFERHLETCPDCSVALDQLRLTTAALRILPDREPPQRIAFVSDKVFAPSRFRNFAPWLGFASAAVLAIALVVAVYHRPAEIQTRTIVMQPASTTTTSGEFLKTALAQTRAQTQEEDTRIFKAALAEAESRHRQQLMNLTDAISVIQAHQNAGLIASEAAGQ